MRTAVRRELAPSEQAEVEAWLAACPEARVEWELDQRLTRCLRRLSDVPLSGDFTERVVLQVKSLSAKPASRRAMPEWVRWWQGWGHGWQWAGAFGVVVVVVAMQYHETRQRAELARSLEALPAISLADVELWRDFESINTLPAGPLPSVDQLAEAFK